MLAEEQPEGVAEAVRELLAVGQAPWLPEPLKELDALAAPEAVPLTELQPLPEKLPEPHMLAEEQPECVLEAQKELLTVAQSLGVAEPVKEPEGQPETVPLLLACTEGGWDPVPEMQLLPEKEAERESQEAVLQTVAQLLRVPEPEMEAELQAEGPTLPLPEPQLERVPELDRVTVMELQLE